MAREPTLAASRHAAVTVSHHVRRVPLEAFSFAAVFGVFTAHLFLSGYNTFYYDAAHYWGLGQSFKNSSGHFSLLAYNDQFRGYSLPLLCHILQGIASALGLGAVTIVKLFGALLAATLGVLVLPRLARQLFPGAVIGPGRVLALNALIFLFWRDHFDFPLTDFPAFLVATIGLLALLRASTGGYLVAGLGFGLATNLRPAYLPGLIAAIAIAALLPYRSRDWRQRGATAALVVAGAFVALLPQIAINHHQRGNWSPLIPGARTIALFQLSDGMLAQKYETFVGPPSRYPRPEVFYLDPATSHVLAEEHIPRNIVIFGQFGEITSYRMYARIVVHHPAEMAASYVRHVFNLLDVKYPTPYVRNLRDTSIALSLLQYTLIFLAVASLLLPDARRRFGGIRWVGVGVLLIPCLTAIPSTAEPRFFLPVQMLIYMLVCFGPSTWGSLLGGSTRRRAALALSYVAFILICLTLSSATLAQLQHPGPTLGLGGTEKLSSSALVHGP